MSGRHPGVRAALAAHLAVRTVGLAVLALMARTADQPPFAKLAAWDGGWYVRIATAGYAPSLDLSADDTGTLAFFPLYPSVMRLLGGAGVPPEVAGVLTSVVAAAVAAVGIFVLVRRLVDARTALAAVLLWSAQPLAIVLSMVYTEALFTAFAVWALYCAHRRWWWAAGALALLSGLTRSSGLAVGAAVAGYAGWMWWRGRTHGPAPLPAGVLALAGTPLWWLVVALRTGEVKAWFVVQDTFWQSRWDWGASVGGLGLKLFTQEVRYSGDAVFVITLTYVLLLLAVVLLVDAVGRRTWWPLLVYAGVVLALTVGSAGLINAKPRFLVPAFPLLLPLAAGLAGASRRVQVLSVGFVVLASAWFGAYLLVVWPYSI